MWKWAHRIIFLSFGAFMLFGGCGKKEEDGRVEYFDIVSELNVLYAAGSIDESRGMFLGMQYYQGEPVQLWSEGDEVYLVSIHGSREKLMEIPQAAALCCYLDQDGSIYCWERYAELAENGIPSVWKYDASGQEVCRVRMEEGIVPEDICQLSDGRILLLLRNQGSGAVQLAELNAMKGIVARLDQVQLGLGVVSGYIASGGEELVFLEQGYWEGLSEISLKDGKRKIEKSFQGGGYRLGANTTNMELQDFRMAEDGSIEILWASKEDGRGVLEILRLKEMEKTVLVMQTTHVGKPAWIKDKIAEFNKRNESYYLVLEYPDVEKEVEYGQMIAMQMAAGKGPDILMDYALDFVDDLAGKGGIADLAPYMEESGMKEEDYFPSAFSRWRSGDKIYSVSLVGVVMYDWLDGRALGLKERPDIETLLDALLAVKEPTTYCGMSLASEILINLIQYTDDYCGMLDWEEGVCDFENELFKKMIQAAGKYGYTWNEVLAGASNTYGKPYVAGQVSVSNIYEYETLTDIEEQGRIPLLNMEGAPYGQASHSDVFAINSNSDNIEGAWEFLSYMMSQEVQGSQSEPMTATNRAVCIEAVQEQIRWLEKGHVMNKDYHYFTMDRQEIDLGSKSWTREDITDEKVAEYINMRDRAEPMDAEEDRRMKPIWQIIREESEAYFTGDKSIVEVADIITNRVQLYLDENQ